MLLLRVVPLQPLTWTPAHLPPAGQPQGAARTTQQQQKQQQEQMPRQVLLMQTTAPTHL